ncbi:hypothetical protein WDU94_010737, partial [Cyamophila willieti]
LPTSQEFDIDPSISNAPNSSAPTVPSNDFLPQFSALQEKSSLPSLEEDDSSKAPQMVQNEFPPLPPPPAFSQENNKNKRKINPEVQTDKKAKPNATTPDPEVTDGFKIMVAALIDSEIDLSISAEEVCGLLAKLKNSHKRKEIIEDSKLPLDELKKVLILIQQCPDTPSALKTRIVGSLTDNKMVLENFDNVNP